MPHSKPAVVPIELKHLADQIGLFIQYWGFKKIHGQVWLHIWLSKEPIDATTLVKRLHVSKALVSLAIKDLMRYEVIKVSGQGDRRKILLIPNTDVQTVISNVLKLREDRMLKTLVESQDKVEGLPTATKETLGLCCDRLEQMKWMTSMAQLALGTLVQSNLDLEQIKN